MLQRILTLDLGGRTGWSTYVRGKIESGTQIFDLRRGESTGMRYIRFNSWLEQMFTLIEPELVVFEMAHHRGGFATELLLGMVTRVEEMCARHKTEYSKVHSATLKKTITGSGRAEKADVIEAVSKKFHKEVVDDNEADALAILAWVEKEFGVPINPVTAGD